jgi:glutamine amidotransferase
MQTIALIDYGAGNLRSAAQAMAAADPQARVIVTADPAIVLAADRLILPGQGAFGDCMAGLRAQPGMIEALTEKVRVRGAPFLGICVGMQLLMQVGLEYGETQGLGWIDGTCRKLETGERLPHMGWSKVTPRAGHAVLAGLAPAPHMYFAHSYAVWPQHDGAIAAEATHGAPFPAAIAADTILGVQFHPEKSQARGLELLARFARWSP